MAKTKTKERPKRPRAKQGFLPDMAPPSHKDIDAAAEQYVDARDARMALMKPEQETKNALIALMKEHGLDAYRTPEGLEVVLDRLEQVKVKRAKPEEDGEE